MWSNGDKGWVIIRTPLCATTIVPFIMLDCTKHDVIIELMGGKIRPARSVMITNLFKTKLEAINNV